MMRAYLDGRFLPLSEARISPMDRGFLYADGVYEVIPVYSRFPFRLEEHLRRLQNSLDGIRLPNPYSAAEWRLKILQLIAETDFDDQAVYLQVTRGADVRRDACFPKNIPQTVFMFSAPLIAPSSEQRETGVKAVTAPDIRWLRCDLKSISLLPNVLTRQLSADVGATETLMLRDGYLTEGSASNVFIVKDGVLLAPPKDSLILPGITYDVVLELTVKHNAPYELRRISEAELRDADEIWVTSSSKEVLAVTTLDDKPVGKGDWVGRPGPLARKTHAWFCEFKEQVMRRPGA
ncbi:MAG: D-amino acid aminotransferase [Candidatus Accumulibacter sp.]|nr:D-amino acid aminotransferase [Accumulibacter sp.]